MRVPFARSWDAYSGASAADVLAGRIAPEQVAGKLVLVGSSALSVGDRVVQPAGRIDRRTAACTPPC